MKIDMNRIYKSVLFAGLASAPFAVAVERPADLDEKPHQLKSKPGEIKPIGQEEAQNWEPEKKIAVVEAFPEQGYPEPNILPQPGVDAVEKLNPVQAAAVAVPYLGVGSTPIDELLSVHLGVDHGVVVQQVHEGSGAFKAGLRKNDILMSFDGKNIVSPLDLRDAVKNREVGDEVVVEFIRKGEKQKEQVVLESRPQGLPGFVPPGMRGMGRLQQVWPQMGQMPAEAQQHIEKLRNMIDQEFAGVGLGLKLNELLEGELPEGDGEIDMNFDAQSSATWSDGKGSITMSMRGGQSEVQVRDTNGDVVFEGPWETEQDKAAVDPEVRNRIENMGVQRQGNQLKFFMEGLPGGR